MSQGFALPALPTPGYFQRRLPAYAILAAFFVLTLPLCLLASLAPDSPEVKGIQLVYLCCLGLTHFVLTPTIYLQSANLRFFNSSWRNRILYFVIPAAILIGFNVYGTLRIALIFPLIDLLFHLTIRLFDFQHFGRQSFGVLQLFKARSGGKFPGWLRRLEVLYFFAIPFLLLATFVRGGSFDPAFLWTRIALLVASSLFIAVLAGYMLAFARAPRPSALVMPLLYFLFQTGSALLATWSTLLYGFALAMHYVEYHVLMMPRCFNIPLDTKHTPDRVFSLLRRSRLVFYALLLALAAGVSVLTNLSLAAMVEMVEQAVKAWRPDNVGGSSFYLLLITMFDGIFVFHYFLESFIWKFSEPHYRQTLGPLYFSPRPTSPAK
jgi:hypothetical protein